MNIQVIRLYEKQDVQPNKTEMKNLYTLIAFLLVCASATGQRTVEALFDRYSGDNDFVSISINADLIRIAKALNCGNDGNDIDYLPSNLTKIRILTQEKAHENGTNFYELVHRELDRKNYEELMRVKNSDHDLVLLARAVGRSYKELLLVGRGKDNLIIQLKGDMTFREARRFAERMKKDCDVNIDIDWD